MYVCKKINNYIYTYVSYTGLYNYLNEAVAQQNDKVNN